MSVFIHLDKQIKREHAPLVCARARALCSCVKGDTLAIDGSGWMFHLLEGQRVDHGGDYDLLHKTVVREVGRLRQVSARGGRGGTAE